MELSGTTAQERTKKPPAAVVDLTGESDLYQGDEVADLLAGLGESGDCCISVSEMNGRKMEWLFDFEPGELDSSKLRATLRDEYGGGDFKIAVRRNGAFVTHKTISVKAPKASRFPVPVSGQGAAPDRLAEVMAMMAQQQQQSANQMQAMMAAIASEGKNQQLEMMKLMLENNRGGGDKQIDVIGLLSIAKDLFNKKDNSVELFIKGMEVARELKPDSNGDDENGLSSVLKTLGAPLAGLMAAHQQKQNNAHVQDEPVPGVELQEVEQMGMVQDMQIRMAAGMFIKAAEKGASVDTYAEIFCEQYAELVPDELLTDVAEFEKIFQIVPDAEPHRAWFEALRLKCVELLFDDVEGEVSDTQ